jgi:hypothetical protein
MYDRPLPASIVAQCVVAECGLCMMPFNGPAVAKSHFEGRTHERKVTQLFKAYLYLLWVRNL